MELWKEINFINAKAKYEESVRKNEKQYNKEISEIKIRQSIKNTNNFKKILENV